MSHPTGTEQRTEPAPPIHLFQATPELRIALPTQRPGWRTAFDRRRAAVAAVITPLTVMLFLDAPRRGSVDHPAEWLVLGTLGVLTALIWASFVPRRDGAEAVAATPCGAMAAVYPVLALMTLGGQPLTPLVGAFTLLLLGWGLTQRVSGTSACG